MVNIEVLWRLRGLVRRRLLVSMGRAFCMREVHVFIVEAKECLRRFLA